MFKHMEKSLGNLPMIDHDGENPPCDVADDRLDV